MNGKERLDYEARNQINGPKALRYNKEKARFDLLPPEAMSEPISAVLHESSLAESRSRPPSEKEQNSSA